MWPPPPTSSAVWEFDLKAKCVKQDIRLVLFPAIQIKYVDQ